LEPERLLLAGERLRRTLRQRDTDFAFLETPNLFFDPHLALETLRETLRFFADALRFFADALRFFIDALRFFIGELRFFIEALRFFIEVLRFFIDALRFFIEALRFLIEALRFFIDALRFFVEALRFMLLVTQRLPVERCAGRPLFARAILRRFDGLFFFEAFFDLSVFLTAENLAVFFDTFEENFADLFSTGILYMSFCLSVNFLHSSPAFLV